MTRIRILVVDDHAILRAGLRMLLERQPDMEVVGEATSGPKAVQKARELQPDIVLLDISMPGGSGLEAIAPLHKASPGSRVLVLTQHTHEDFVRTAIASGAAGYLSKNAGDGAVIEAIRQIRDGRWYVDVPMSAHSVQEAIATRPMDAQGKPTAVSLSGREREVVRYLSLGHTNQETADMLGLSVKTVETYRARVYDKLGLRSRAGMVRYALEVGLLGGPRNEQS